MHPAVIAVYLHWKTRQHSNSSIGGSPHECDWALLRSCLPGRFADYTPVIVPVVSWQYPSRCHLSNSDLSSHAVNQLLGIVSDPSLKHRLDVLDLVNSF